MRVVFFGSPDFAVASLAALLASPHAVLAAVTQPDRPRGRGRASLPSAVKARALAHGLPVHEPLRLKGELTARVRELRPDALVVVAYGRILPPELLAVPPRGAVNVHASLLPRHRGASPIAHAILAGDDATGVTTMMMDAGLDTGAMLLHETTPIGPEEGAVALGLRLAAIGAHLLVRTLDRLEAGDLAPAVQDERLATYAPKLSVADAALDWALPAAALARRVRALEGWPGTVTTLPGGKRLRVLRARAAASGERAAPAAPGTVLGAGPDGLRVACKAGDLLVLSAQPEGGRAQSAQDLVNGRQVRVGERLGA